VVAKAEWMQFVSLRNTDLDLTQVCIVAGGVESLIFCAFESYSSNSKLLKKVVTPIRHSHVLHEMRNGWIVDGRGFIISGRDPDDSIPLLFVWDFHADQCVQLINVREDETVFTIAELRDGQIAASCTKSVRCWDVISGQELFSIDTSPVPLRIDHCYIGIGKDMIKSNSDDIFCFSNLALINWKTKEVSRGSNCFVGNRMIRLKNGTIVVSKENSDTLTFFRIPTRLGSTHRQWHS